MSRQSLWAALALSLNALVWGIAWWPFRALEQQGLHPLWVTALVYGAATLAMTCWRPGAWSELLRARGLWVLLLAAGATNIGFNWAVTIGDVVRVILLFYLMPAWVVVLAWALVGERPTPGSLLRLALALGGVFVMLKAPDAAWPLPRDAADLLALLGGFSLALTNVMLRRLRHSPESGRMLAMFVGGALLPLLVASVGSVQGALPFVPPPQWGWVGLVAVLAVMFVAGNLALQYGASHLRANVAALIMLSEVVFAAASSVALGASTLSERTLLGGGLIVLSAVLAALSNSPDEGAKSRD